jgi:ketosteroid isomerase-like protein
MRSLLAAFLILIVAAMPQVGTATDAQDSQDIADDIWALEDAYIAAYEIADHESILALMDERFLGWPDSKEKPTTYDEVRGFLAEKYGAPGTWNFDIERAGIRIHGGVVITHYILVVSARGAAESAQAQETRITHTWIRSDAGWKILGGMSSVR